MNKKIVIIGATSSIAQSMAKQWADQGNELFLIARNTVHLKAISDDVSVRSKITCKTALFDALDNNQIQSCLTEAINALGKIDVLVIAHGTLPDQNRCSHDLEMTLAEFQVNAVSYIGLLTAFSGYFEKQKSGSIIVFSSCAADCGRPSNYLYGAAKAAVATFSDGLSLSLQNKGVHVMTVKPGFVDTEMTKNFKKGFLWAQPDSVARSVILAMNKKKTLLYVPGFWRYIMIIVKCLPNKILSRM